MLNNIILNIIHLENILYFLNNICSYLLFVKTLMIFANGSRPKYLSVIFIRENQNINIFYIHLLYKVFSNGYVLKTTKPFVFHTFLTTQASRRRIEYNS